jgi:hypothetical protein
MSQQSGDCMKRYLRPFLCLPLLAATACTADAVAGPEPEAAVQAAAELPASAEDAAARLAPAHGGLGQFAAPAFPRSREPVYIIDGVVVPSLAGVDPSDIAETQVLTPEVASSLLFCGPAANGVVIVTTRAAASRRR